MKTKSTNRFVAAALALFMLLTCVSFTGIKFTSARAEDAGNVHTFDVGEYTKDMTETESKKIAITGEMTADGGYFTIYPKESGSRFDTQRSDKYDDGYVAAARLNLGGAADVSKKLNVVGFTTKNPATVKLWWAANTTDRQMAIMDESGTQVASTEGEHENNKTYLDTLTLTKAGTYYLGSVGGAKAGGQYIQKVEVTEEVPANNPEYTLVANDIEAGDKTVYGGVSKPAGTDDYFTIDFGDKGKIEAKKDGEEIKFDDGFVGKNSVNFDGATTFSKGTRVIKITTADKAQVKVWWVCGGAEREVEIYDVAKGEVITKTATGGTSGAAYISTLKLDNAGEYYIGGPKNYFYKIVVTEGEIKEDEATAWADVAAPEIVSAVQATDGKTGALTNNITVTANAVVGKKGGDKLVVTMYDKDGKALGSKTSLNELKTSHELSFAASASGTYTFKAVLVRDGETDKESASKNAEFKLLLATPSIVSGTSKGDGKVELVWTAVPEATGYEIYCDGTKAGTAKADKTTYMITGLTVGKKYALTVKAVRASETGEASGAKSVTVTKEAQQTWGFVFFGTSTDKTNDYFTGDLNEDGKVTVYSVNGKGKVNETTNDGIALYYTAVPTNLNFSLTAKVHIDKWTYSNGQEGVGLYVMDSLPTKPNSSDVHWTNTYMAAATIMKYNYDANKADNANGGVLYGDITAGTRYQMYVGLGVNHKLGITPENLDDVYTAKAKPEYGQYPLDLGLALKGLPSGKYNTLGNVTNPETVDDAKAEAMGKSKPGITTAYELTDFTLRIERNNTGYFLSYLDNDGKVIRTQKFYDTKALDQLDKDYVYVGMFCARNVQATFSDVVFTTIAQADDKTPVEEKPIDYVTPKVSVTSSTVANTENYDLYLTPNVAGSVKVTIGDKVVGESDKLVGGIQNVVKVKISSGDNKLVVTFTPDPDQDLGEAVKLENTDPVVSSLTVKYNTYLEKQNNLYVSPKGTKNGNGGKEHPLDIYTAVDLVRAGQTIILMEGTYALSAPITIQRGMDGTADAKIYMIADPEAKTRPVIDFQKKSAGITAAGNYWYFQGFDVCNAQNKAQGFNLCGSYCTLDKIDAYNNGDSGIYIHSFRNTSDARELWPHDNLILNCTAHNNSDAGYEDADGFACKLTAGDNNVFDGCIAYNNADDGWDLYARTSSGSIGKTIIKNCVAYNNGYLEDGTNAGNGNGFKLGGENLPAGHTISNSIAFNNKANGITSNSCPDVKVYDCTVFNNESANINLYSGYKGDTDFKVKGLISFRAAVKERDASKINAALTTADMFKGNGAQATTTDWYTDASNYIWDGSASKNSTGVELTADIFESLEFSGKVERNENGTINMNGFLVLTDKAPADAGAIINSASGTASENVTITADTDLPPVTGVEFAVTIAVIVLAAAAALVLISKRRRA